MTSSADSQKLAAAKAAVEYIEEDMVVGLGTGSTAAYFVKALAGRVADGLTIQGVATSLDTEKLATAHKIPVLDPDDVPAIDVTVDGADELDDALQLIKGGGAALLREKIIAASSARMIVIADASKHVERLGAFALPVEVVPFGAVTTRRRICAMLTSLGYDDPKAAFRTGANGKPLITDGGHVLLDCALGQIADAPALAEGLSAIPGVVDHGLFLDMAERALIGTADGISVLTRQP